MTLSTPTRGIQLALAAQQPRPRRGHGLIHPPCPVCAGPTARHGRRIVCIVCGHGAQEHTRQAARQSVHHPRRHPN